MNYPAQFYSNNSYRIAMNAHSLELHIKEQRKKELEKRAQKIKLVLNKFMDPFLPHRIVGDFIIPDKLSPFQNNYLYSYKLDLTHKQLSQIHVRNNGVIFEYEENDPYFIPPMELVKARLESLGNNQAYELSKYLVQYQKLYDESKTKTEHINVKFEEKSNVKVEGFPDPAFQNLQKNKKNNNEAIFKWIDEQLLTHKDDVMFCRGNRVISENDFRMCFMCFNFKFLEWILSQKDINFFEDSILEEISNCFVFRNVESYMEEITNFIKGKIFNLSKAGGYDYYLDIKTLIGVFTLKWNFYFNYFANENKSVFCFVHPKEIHKKEIIESVANKRVEKEKKSKRGCDWGQLVYLYYKDYPSKQVKTMGPVQNEINACEESKSMRLYIE